MSGNHTIPTMSIPDTRNTNEACTPSKPDTSTAETSLHEPRAEISPFFRLPAEVRNIIYAALLSLEDPFDLYTTNMDRLRGTIGIAPPPSRLLSKRFNHELQHMHEKTRRGNTTPSPSASPPSPPRPQFPQTISLQLAIQDPLEYISVTEKVQWAEEYEYPRFTAIPQCYKSQMKTLHLECSLSPNLHLLPGFVGSGDTHTLLLLEPWIASLNEWIYDTFIRDAAELERVELTFLVDGHVEEYEGVLGWFLGMERVRRVSVEWEDRLGSRVLAGCAEGWEFLRRVERVKGDGVEEWVEERVVY